MLVGLLGAPARAQRAEVHCPLSIDGLPLHTGVPFSGTVRSTPAGGSLRCAYGEGVRPAVDLTVAWPDDAGCGRPRYDVAPPVDPAAVRATADLLVGALGGPCPVAAVSPGGTGSPWLVALGAVAVAALAGGLAVRRRAQSRPRRAPAPGPAPQPPGPDLATLLTVLEGPGGRDFAVTPVGRATLAAAEALARTRVEVPGG